jgi:hypothetical protein
MKKKLTKLGIKKVTLRNLDDPALGAIAGGATNIDYTGCYYRTCNAICTDTQKECTVGDTVCAGTCVGTRCV